MKLGLSIGYSGAALAGGGRVIAGLGVSGPQMVEGWYGQPWRRPHWRIRDYVAITRKVFERKEPVAHMASLAGDAR
jgi:alkanesulfonate monooxygenase SsuD/methylene tetrahydromethanopterin reductase-like flavin-dependent oxidoreductase (luciferase family)